MNASLLATFVEVADAASFSGAARILGTTTATVSRSIAKLEESIGSRLFHRTTRRVSLTTAGTALYQRAAAHVRALAHATKELPEQQNEPAGTLKLTAPYDLGATFLGSVIARFIALYPKVQVQAEFGSRVVDLAAEGFDIALRGDTGKHKDTSLTARRLVTRGELNLYASPSYLPTRGAPAVSRHPITTGSSGSATSGFRLPEGAHAQDRRERLPLLAGRRRIGRRHRDVALVHRTTVCRERRPRPRTPVGACERRRPHDALFVDAAARAQDRRVSGLHGGDHEEGVGGVRRSRLFAPDERCTEPERPRCSFPVRIGEPFQHSGELGPPA